MEEEVQLSRGVRSPQQLILLATKVVTVDNTADRVHLRQGDKQEASGEEDAGRPLPPHRTVPGLCVGLRTRPVECDQV